MIRTVFATLFLLACAAFPASAQVTNPGVQQQGAVVSGNCVKWVSAGKIQDAGATCAGSSPVQSVFGRTGNVVAQSGDYSFSLISGTLGCAQLPSFTGDVTNVACALTLATVNASPGTFGTAARTATITVNAKGLATAVSDQLISVPFSQITGTLACTQFPALTGDITTSAGACATTLATVNASPGSFGSATQCVSATVNAKGLITALSAATCTPAFSSLTGQATLAQLPSMAANTVLSNWTSGSATPLANTWPACANDGSHALVYVNGSGLACATIAAGGTVTTLTAGTGISFSSGATCTTTCTISNSGIVTATVAGTAGQIAVSGSCLANGGTCTIANASVSNNTIISNISGGSAPSTANNAATVGASWVLIQAQSGISGVTAVNFTTGLTSTYDEYIVTYDNVQIATDTANLILQISEDGGSTYKSANYQWAQQGYCTTNSAVNSSNASDTAIMLQRDNSNGAGNISQGTIYLSNLSGSTQAKSIRTDNGYWFTGSLLCDNHISGAYTGDTNAINAFRILTSSGNQSGNYYLWARRKS